MKRKGHMNSSGFTIIELMISSAVFSILLLLMATGMIEIGRMFFKGMTYTSTQEATRAIVDDISQAIQFSGEPVVNPITSNGAVQGMCIGNRRYSYAPNVQLTGGNHALVVDRWDTTCNSLTPAQSFGALSANSKELLGRNMRLVNLQVTCAIAAPNCPSKVYNVTVRVAYGDDDLLVNLGAPNAQCRTNIPTGTQFCSVSELSTTVKRRVNSL